MRNQILFFSAIFSVLLFSACTNRDEKLKKDIIGTYYYSLSEETDGVFVTIEGRETFKASGNVENKGTFVISIIEETGRKISLKYDLSVAGEYDIKNSYIIYDYDLNNIMIESQKDQTGIDKFIAEYLSSIFEEHLIPSLKQEMISNNESKIVELTESKLVIEENGNRHSYKREK